MDSMSDSSSSLSNSTMMMMVPYLHFTEGDPLYFQQWRPNTPGAIAGACVGLVFLSIFERWLAAARRVLNSFWRRRAFLLTSLHDRAVATREMAPEIVRNSDKKVAELVSADVENLSLSGNSIQHKSTTAKSRLRTVAPFVMAHDVPRGVLYAFQTLVFYLLMLAVMTFQAAFFFSIALGLGIGEIIFGRIVNMDGDH